MRKTGRKPMAGGIVALSLILTGTGYAYWTDTLNVTTKATTGDLEVTFADLGLYAQYANETKTDGWSIVDGIGDTGYVADDFFMRGTNYNSIIIARTAPFTVKATISMKLPSNSTGKTRKIITPWILTQSWWMRQPSKKM